jgi:hypothetical protein
MNNNKSKINKSSFPKQPKKSLSFVSQMSLNCSWLNFSIVYF